MEAGVKVRCVRYSPDGRLLAAGCEDGAVRIWELGGAADPQTLPAAPLPVYDLAFSPLGGLLASCTGDWTKTDPGVVTLWSTDAWSEARRLTEHTRAVRSVVFSVNGDRFATSGEDGLVIVRHGESHAPIARLTNPGGVRPLAFSPDGTRLAAGLHDGTIHVWSVARGELVQRFKAEDDVFALTFSGDGSALYSVSGETRVEVWPVVEVLPSD
jgi:WD40 repeat protein